jgi:hypothetical protein
MLAVSQRVNVKVRAILFWAGVEEPVPDFTIEPH